MKTANKIRSWVENQIKEIEAKYEEEQSNPDIEEMIESCMYLHAEKGVLVELLRFIDEDN